MKKFRRPLDVFDSEVLDCVYGQYPWDDWERDALAAGVPKALAGLGRLTTTERYLRLTITDLKEAHAKFHPREQQLGVGLSGLTVSLKSGI
jgi:hypothetical protein